MAELEAVEIRSNPWVAALAALPLVLVPVLALATSISATDLINLATWTIPVSIWAFLNRPLARKVPVVARIDDAGVTIDDGKHATRLDTSSIRRGVRVPRGPGGTVRLETRQGRRELALKSEDDADRLLERLGLDPRTMSASFTLGSRALGSPRRETAMLFGLLLLVAALTGLRVVFPAIPPLSLFATFVVIMAVVMAPSRVEVGGDGVLIHWLGRHRFIAHHQIESVRVGRTRRGKHVELMLSDGEEVRIGAMQLDPEAAGTLEKRILDAKNAAASGSVAPTAMLQRSKRSHREWVQALRKREVTGLRSPAVPKDHLWPLIEDPSTGPLERAAAVVALGRDLGDADRARLARVAKAVAAPKLRVVLQDGPDAEEDELVEMLVRIEAELPEASH